MNEQLVVKNFGPIKDATVDFKRVTVFIGPTGGGKSTLAKLAATVKQGKMIDFGTSDASDLLSKYGIANYIVDKKSFINWKLDNDLSFCIDSTKELSETSDLEIHKVLEEDYEINHEQYKQEMNEELERYLQEPKGKLLPANLINDIRAGIDSAIKDLVKKTMVSVLFPLTPHYIPAERVLLSSIGNSWAGIIRDDIGLSKLFVEFANDFFVARNSVNKLELPFLNAEYCHEDNRDTIKQVNFSGEFNLYETASGIQSVTPMLVLLEHLSRNTEQAQSYIIEEPELNLYPTAQQGLLNWLVEKCTKGENDLTITTHSPYILSHLNLLLYAYQVAEQHPERANEVAELVPRASWINPKEFACYQVENGGVSSLVNDDLGLIDDNALDGLSGDAADAFDNLIRLSKGVALK